jgi:hypothetical protein
MFVSVDYYFIKKLNRRCLIFKIVIEVLTQTNRARKYWSDPKNKLVDEGYSEVS